MILIAVFSLLFSAIVNCASEFELCDEFEVCGCFQDDMQLVVDCTGRGLEFLPEGIPNEVQKLICSDNAFRELPQELRSYSLLEEIDFSGNRIKKISAAALDGLSSLRKLDLSRNNITKLSDINSARLFIPAIELSELDLSFNPISSLSYYEDSGTIHSHTLKILSLSNCQIQSLVSKHFFKHMTKLEILDVSHNPLKMINNITSDSLVYLDASHCQISYIPTNAFIDLKKLIKLDLSWNHRVLLSWSSHPVRSDSLKELDISYCNMENLQIEGFPNLMSLIARGNLIRELTDKCFANNTFLEKINLSANAISTVNWNAFKLLQDLRHVDLSWNVIPMLDSKTFATNDHLKTINLSRNHFSRLDMLMAPAVDYLDLSWCEIQHISKNALASMPSLTDLDLSHNLISEIPDRLSAPRLRTLDLTLCRIKSLRNETLSRMPHLIKLLLSGNRLTTPFRESYFAENFELRELDLSDNPWRCDCNSEIFMAFFRYLRTKVEDPRSLKCETPEEVAGRTWSGACNAVWNPNVVPVSRTEKIWMFLMVTMLSFAGCMCVVMSVRRAMLARAEAARIEEQRVAEEVREREQEQRMRNERGTAQRNAPDPRELVSPPCYEEALLMPRLDGSFASLGHLPSGSRDNLRNKVKNRTQSEANILKASSRIYQRPAEVIVVPPPQSTQSTVNIPVVTPVSESSASESSTESVRSTEENVVVQDSNEIPVPVRIPIPKTPPPKYKERRSDTSAESIDEIIEHQEQQPRVRRESDL